MDRVYRFLSRKRRERYNAIFKLVSLLDDLADRKREELLQQKSDLENDESKNDEDLLTMMLKAEMRGVGAWTREELRVCMLFCIKKFEVNICYTVHLIYFHAENLFFNISKAQYGNFLFGR